LGASRLRHLGRNRSDGGNVTTDEAAENIKITVFLGEWTGGAALPSKVDASFVSSLSSFLESFPLIS
jgi:hypothetical protein